jgi:hypothetical protein
MIKHLPLLAALALFLTGCVNERGISARYYNECREYYDLHGYHHKDCDPNLVEYDTVGKAVQDAFEEAPPADRKVW